MGVKVVWLHILHVAHGINEAIRWVHGDGHHTPIVVDKEAEGVPLAWVTPGFKGIMHRFQVDLYVGHKVKNLFWGIEVGLDVVEYESYIDISDLLMLVIYLEDKENGCSPTELESALETVLAVEGVPRYGTLAGKLQEYLVEVECGHLKEQVGSLLQV